MEVSSRGSKTTEFHVSRKWKGRDPHISPEKATVWIDPNKYKATGSCSERKKVPVIYYLSRNGQLEHPHFMDVPLSSQEGLHLRDVINRLNVLRGKGMASLYTWSCKRSYRNGFVWHDLSENDFVYPAHGQEYVLKGSELLHPSSINSNPLETASSSSFRALKTAEESSDFPPITRRRNQSWSSIDLKEYKIYKTEPNSESFRRVAADASTQTDDKRWRRRLVKVEVEDKSQNQSQESYENPSTELSSEEISPPPSDSSPETLESLMKADGRLILCSGNSNEANLNRPGDYYPSGRMKASAVLMQLISCGAISFKDCGPSHVKDHGFSLIEHYKGRLPRGGSGEKKERGTEKEIHNHPRVIPEDKEDKDCFSGSLIETDKKEEVPPALKRSNSCDADRSSQLHLAEKETERVRAKCLPRKPKGLPTKRESTIDGQGASCSNAQQLNMGTKDSKSNN